MNRKLFLKHDPLFAMMSYVLTFVCHYTNSSNTPTLLTLRMGNQILVKGIILHSNYGHASGITFRSPTTNITARIKFQVVKPIQCISFKIKLLSKLYVYKTANMMN